MSQFLEIVADGQHRVITMPDHSFDDGDIITITQSEHRWYIRLFYWLTLRSAPGFKMVARVTASEVMR
jgi:hypothetical protein